MFYIDLFDLKESTDISTLFLSQLGQSLISTSSDLFVKSHREPVENFNDRHKAYSKAESTNATNVGNEVQPGHLPRSLKL